jgi:hypothetical protein
MQAITLSDAALALFRRHVEQHGHLPVDEITRPLYRELAAAGFVRAGSTFLDGPESIYRLTREGFERKAELLAIASAPDSAA